MQIYSFLLEFIAKKSSEFSVCMVFEAISVWLLQAPSTAGVAERVLRAALKVNSATIAKYKKGCDFTFYQEKRIKIYFVSRINCYYFTVLPAAEKCF